MITFVLLQIRIRKTQFKEKKVIVKREKET